MDLALALELTARSPSERPLLFSRDQSKRWTRWSLLHQPRASNMTDARMIRLRNGRGRCGHY